MLTPLVRGVAGVELGARTRVSSTSFTPEMCFTGSQIPDGCMTVGLLIVLLIKGSTN